MDTGEHFEKLKVKDHKTVPYSEIHICIILSVALIAFVMQRFKQREIDRFAEWRVVRTIGIVSRKPDKNIKLASADKRDTKHQRED